MVQINTAVPFPQLPSIAIGNNQTSSPQIDPANFSLVTYSDILKEKYEKRRPNRRKLSNPSLAQKRKADTRLSSCDETASEHLDQRSHVLDKKKVPRRFNILPHIYHESAVVQGAQLRCLGELNCSHRLCCSVRLTTNGTRNFPHGYS
jgi:hypothetical protein